MAKLRMTVTPATGIPSFVAWGGRAPEPCAALSQLAAVVNSCEEAVIAVDLEGRITAWNAAAERVFGYSAEETLGRPAAMLGAPGRMDDGATLIERVRRGERVERFETLRMDKEGRPVRVAITAWPVVERAGVVAGACMIVRDLTSWYEWERTRRLLAAVVETSEDAIITKDVDGLVMTWNAAAERMFGYTAEEMLGRSINILIPEERRAEEVEIMTRLRAGERVRHFETVRRTKDGRLLDISLTISPLRGPDGEFFGASKIARDITERKRTERLLAEHREHLNELVERRTAELRASEHRLRLSERMASLGTLAAGLGHDMGNLLLPVRMRLEAIADLAPQELRADLQAIEQTIKYLGQLTSGLRLLAHDPGGAEAMGESTAPAEWWSEVAALMRSAVPRHVALTSRMGTGVPPVRMSKAALTQAVFNLVQNAGDALRQRSEGRVEAWAEVAGDADASGAGMVRIGVTDDGPGMTEEVRNRCMEPFFSTKPRGISTGLGLSLVQGVVQRAGGNVEIRSAPGEGTTVILIVPAAAPAPAGEGGNGRRCARALVSVADSRTRSYVKQVLSALEFECASDGAGGPPGASADGPMLWVTDESATPASVAAFLEGDPRRRVVVYGQAPGDLDATRVVTVAAPLQPTVMRDQLVRAARAVLNR